MQKLKKIIALVLCISIALLSCGCGMLESYINPPETRSYYAEGTEAGPYRDNLENFQDMEYVRPEIKTLEDKADAVRALLDDFFSHGEDIMKALNDFVSEYWNYETMLTLALLRSDIDIEDEYYLDEYNYCAQNEAEVHQIMEELFADCYDSSHYLYLDTYYFYGNLDEKYSYDDTYDDEYVSMLNDEAELLSQYDVLLNEFYNDGAEDYDKYYDDAANIYIELIKLRREMADYLEYDSYADMCYEDYGRDYSYEDTVDYCDAVKKYIVPLFEKSLDNGVYSDAYLYGLSSINPEDALEVVRDTVCPLDKNFEKAMSCMTEYGLFDVSASDSKTGGSYMTYLYSYDAPFMYVDPVGTYEDVLTIAHEFGHFSQNFRNHGNCMSLDSDEVFSQGMEYLLLCNMEDGNMKEQLTDFKMMDCIMVYVFQGCLNQFENEVYNTPTDELTPEYLSELFASCMDEFGYDVEGQEESYGHCWIDIGHLFNYPFYVISYLVSDTAAFRLYSMELEEEGSGLESYLALVRGSARHSFIELLEKKGLGSPLDTDTIKNMSIILSEKLELG